jgi:hypothetical protein
MTVTVTDSGYRMTEDGGRTWHVGRVRGYTEDNEALKNSCHSVAIHPTDDSLTVLSSGFKGPGIGMRLFRSDEHFPDSYVGTPGALGTAHASSPWVRVRDVNEKHGFMQWNRDTPTVVYASNVRSTNSGVSWGGYASGFGQAVRVFDGDHDIVYGLSRTTGPERYTLRRSNDCGVTIASAVSIPWAGLLFKDLFYAILAIHPTDPAIFFTVGSTGDLARYDGNTGTWRTGYGMPARHLAAHPGPPAEVKSIALDPQDANVGYVAMNSPGNHGIWRSLDIQAVSPSWEDITKDFHRSTVPPKVWVHPLTGDVMAGSDGVGGIRLLPPPGRRSHPSLIGNWPAL